MQLKHDLSSATKYSVIKLHISILQLETENSLRTLDRLYDYVERLDDATNTN